MQPTKSPIRRAVPPYDTGKVKIGLAYAYAQPWSPSRDSYDLQTALLPRSAVPLPFSARVASFLRSFV